MHHRSLPSRHVFVRALACVFAFVVTLSYSERGRSDESGSSAAPNASATVDAKSPDAEYARHMAKGINHFNAGACDAALPEFQAAYRAKPTAGPLVNQALCYKKLGRINAAIAVLEQALAQHKATFIGGNEAAAKREVDELRLNIAWLKVTVTPADARLSIGGNAPPDAVDGLLPFDPGTNHLAFEAEGYEPTTRTVQLLAGPENPAIDIALVARTGEVEIRANKHDAWIAIDGEGCAQGSFLGRLAPGVHIAEIKGSGSSNALQIVVTTGKRTAVEQRADGTLTSTSALAQTAAKPTVRQRLIDEVELPVYAYGSAGALLVPQPVEGFVRDESRVGSGFAVGVGGGLRVAEWGAFETFGQYNDIRMVGNYSAEHSVVEARGGAAEIAFRGGRIGVGLRAMLKLADVFRLVGVLGGGVAIETVTVTSDPPLALTTEGLPAVACPVCKSPLLLLTDEVGVDAFGQLDLGAEFEFDHVLLGIFWQFTAQSSKHLTPLTTNAFDNRPVGFVGPKIQIGYALW
ncbi:MAG: hypothetical protein EXR75_14745 [Myxococcales bacterium]|nr:hypothetical protein [Myxococcales bacterium]